LTRKKEQEARISTWKNRSEQRIYSTRLSVPVSSLLVSVEYNRLFFSILSSWWFKP
jgi:hypothetical protein